MKEKSPVLPKSHDWPHFIIQSMADGVITVDGEMHITDLYRAAEKFTSYSRQEALGRFCGEVLQSSQCGQECPLKAAMVSGEAVSREAILQNHLGQKVEIMLTASALRDNQGNLLGGVETFRDIGPLKQMENERRQLAGMFAHDLKGPVVGVAGLVDRLRQGKMGELTPNQTAFLNTIYQEILRLEKLITNFLDFVRLDLHMLKPLPSAVQVEKECLEAIFLQISSSSRPIPCYFSGSSATSWKTPSNIPRLTVAWPWRCATWVVRCNSPSRTRGRELPRGSTAPF
jgi:PAS domain S-box-containing protein